MILHVFHSGGAKQALIEQVDHLGGKQGAHVPMTTFYVVGLLVNE